VVKTIEDALRTFQHTRITNTSECIAEEKAAYLARLGCGHASKVEVIHLAFPVRFNDLMRSRPDPNGKVYEIIASVGRGYPGHPRVLELGLGREYGALHGQQTIRFFAKSSTVDFLRLSSGECSEALPPSEVPKEI
jgi:hypothetical protein